ncbi:hypothetical protein AG1IA_08131 [Rhizoctonia solani AG-1 IA]|uniref:Uncharacterized protein n=1 Tax=Thanatephorus cucumeris (strain AG1-IA) TaxID=983506 RepID=L8WNC4_THACA|nr:hypothetical protein AG1IA_08131 [Rhizoctonia solani AG-1 IA]
MVYLGFPIESPTTLLVNNAAAIAYSNNPVQKTHCTRSIYTDFMYQFFHSLIHAEGGIPTLRYSDHILLKKGIFY